VCEDGPVRAFLYLRASRFMWALNSFFILLFRSLDG
jgi:hypothetical protein